MLLILLMLILLIGFFGLFAGLVFFSQSVIARERPREPAATATGRLGA